MERFFNNTKKLIFHRQKDILSSALILASMIIVSRFFGFIRYRTLATFFTKEELDIFFASFRLPDFVFEMLITGALSSAFIPIFIKYKKNEKDFAGNISSIINLISGSLFVVVVFLFLTAGFIIPKITPGFDREVMSTVITLSQILLLTQLPLLVFGNILSGIGQANKIFIITAIAPVLYNVGIILGTIFFSQQFWLYGPIMGVVVGAILFFAMQLPIISITHFRFIPFVFEKQAIKEFIGLFVPRVMSVMTAQIDITIDLTLSTLLGAGNYTIFFFSQSLQLLPVSVIGMAFGQASLPYISELFKADKLLEIRRIIIDSILQLFYVSIPFSFFLIFSRTPLVRLVFGGPKFDWVGTNLTALTVSIFAISIPAHTIFYFLTRTFYAAHDTKTPFYINVVSILINTSISIFGVLVLHLPVWSLALAFSVSMIINTLLHLIFLFKKVGGLDVRKLFSHTIKIYWISFIASIVGYFSMRFLDIFILETTRTLHVFMLLSTTLAIYMGMYVFLSWFFSIEEIYVWGKLLVKIDSLKRKVLELYTGVGS
ncbi:hypothetical protein A2690_03045 [Candidatus Roizmanbacteria bacterium RIFCSPHIGHO2_01_FULL_39_12b]|uniref:Lipid II flippase n=1 Tax=Candidatus Roizmanbacteria bacterium RIFCSPHIGHO2_01_FULL_39_12b TaxID=1802030 RepID=A0A1F7G967_9BACT|nr:MAG: hypothetical protein A2690_03045 [Candidatus Roizmanbacteria bacterium RIFCSPHIGHO2_01_FULL_39_12b]OGK45957.1 MAG: hypothetical protein A3B46_00155 [Candidatus Roizmanbacteria bacterium RIFCSPLOWO2_01_FULL_39_19]